MNTQKNRIYKDLSKNGKIPNSGNELNYLKEPDIEIELIDDGKIKLKRQLGTVYGVAIIVGLVIGGGIYITPQGVLKHAGSPGLSLVVWVTGGIITLIGALCYAEIGVNYPIAGEKYAYLTEMYGSYFGFIYLAQYLLLLRPGSNSFKVLLLGRYLLKPLYPDCNVPELVVMFVATFMGILMCGLNCISVKFAARGQSVMTSLTVLTLLIISAMGIYTAVTDNSENMVDSFQNSSTDIGSLVMSFYSTVFAYGGWSALNFLIEEVKDPKKTLPKSIVISCVLLTILYTLVNFSYLVILGKEGVLTSDAVAISVALKVWTPLAYIMSICIAISTSSSFNSGVLVGSRLAFAGARNGHIPQMISYVSISQITPIMSLVIQGILVSAYVWFMKIDFLIYNLTFCSGVCDLFVVLGYIRIRYKNRNQVVAKDKLRLPIAIHIIYAIKLIIISFVPLVTNFVSSAIVFVLIVLTSSVYYVIFIMWRPTFIRRNKTFEKMNEFIQKLFYCAPGGKNV